MTIPKPISFKIKTHSPKTTLWSTIVILRSDLNDLTTLSATQHRSTFNWAATASYTHSKLGRWNRRRWPDWLPSKHVPLELNQALSASEFLVSKSAQFPCWIWNSSTGHIPTLVISTMAPYSSRGSQLGRIFREMFNLKRCNRFPSGHHYHYILPI